MRTTIMGEAAGACMDIEAAVLSAARAGASDLHLEAGLPATLRVDGSLRRVGAPLSGAALRAALSTLLGPDAWQAFRVRGSADLSRTLAGMRCRVAVLRSARGVGAAIRLLSNRQVSIRSLNIHSDVLQLARAPHGLVLVTGPTGSGKSTTIAALVNDINQREAKHIVTLEQPIEYALVPKRSLIRQREVGRDTPSFDQGLMDVLREDPDVVVVGEMRWPETIRLTLNAAETGHLVFSTVHASSCSEALSRIISAFAAEEQAAVRAILADALVGVVAQKLLYRDDLGFRVPSLEVLVANDAVRSVVRTGNMRHIPSLLETNAEAGMWSRQRYARWLAKRKEWSQPATPGSSSAPELPAVRSEPVQAARPASKKAPLPRAQTDQGVLVLDGFEDDLASVLSEL